MHRRIDYPALGAHMTHVCVRICVRAHTWRNPLTARRAAHQMFCVMPATAVLLFVSSKFNVGLLTLWMASGTLLLARVAVLSWRYNSSEVRSLPPCVARGQGARGCSGGSVPGGKAQALTRARATAQGPLQDKQIAKQRQKDAQEDRNRLANS